MDNEILDEFMAELTELLSTLERDLVSVDEGRDPSEVVAQTFRIFHTVKGTAGFLGFSHLRELAHAAEDVLDAVRDGSLAWSRPITDLLLEVLDALHDIVTAITASGTDGSEGYSSLIERLRAAEEGTAKKAEVAETAKPPQEPVGAPAPEAARVPPANPQAGRFP